ncbi:MAG: cation transporter [Candidatus Zixiibacteriota bacterium]|nr:MAG: cation transporter [candidate division Zixibacteria bacterium]
MNNHHRTENEHRLYAENGIIEKRLTIALSITGFIFVMELVGGFLSNSLALKSDAGHLFGDVTALGLSLLAVRLSRLPPSSKRTFGYHRSEVLAAIINGTTLLFLSIYIFYKAYHRLMEPEPIKSDLMLVVAVIGFSANIFVLFKLRGHASENLNVRAAFLHVMGDMLASVGVVMGGVIMLFTGNYIADPLISFLVGVIILIGAVGVLREGVNILLEGVPQNIDYDELKKDIEFLADVKSIHDLHIWAISSSRFSLSAHILVSSQSTHSSQEILRETQKLLSDKYGISHVTLQFECECCPNEDCGCRCD